VQRSTEIYNSVIMAEDDWVPLDSFALNEIEDMIKTTMETPPEHCDDGCISCVDILVTLLEYHLEYLWQSEFVLEDPYNETFYWSWQLNSVWGSWTRAVCDRDELKMMDEEESD